MRVIIMAKEPIPGQVKTRLCPPCTPRQAAQLAEAAILDTVDAALRSSADEVVLALDGNVGDWCPPGIRVIDQGSGPFHERLERVWASVGAPAVQIGMDTPQVTPDDLDRAMDALRNEDADCVLGMANDGGWWILGLNELPTAATIGSTSPGLFDNVPMSSETTGVRQSERLTEIGYHPIALDVLVDVDTIDDAASVAAAAPTTRFAEALRPILDDHLMSTPP